ncbi:Dolichyl-phosphate beta-glucosyltransferase [Trichinella nativa]|uniref:Dolichyl-phosphate beta-glucosyltransferase n=4 Tax=Trichinella TaxID=6333 RepID=A0A0V1LBG1_9BILA|nr:dolichyl-phosphate beta-glucosyltransferase [Trichinella spiralis]KRX43929.1 Dolichyl-phosphate beta-glucosyltransferase [Trichinella murrelli]KRY46919.1 Dolichyl-phosphate beta-glucosyltransferase [Trichinella britovi]KRZ56832.1 Dolichyl-phosphate beta-glucosyltransferase [Trichinella nativa]KRZ91273.1 Dolichyl-phosphate beta-glucosyltransferase [Trichinella sp. T8]KRY37444.1 Dolichyl-phosphate beta-glucosyltransferase [Trichinella spiralis]
MYVRYEEENFFIDPSDVKKKLKCPSIDDEPSVYLSVIIPAKDEEKRLPKMLDQCIDYLHTRSVKDPKFTYEIIVVDDGSSDRTAEVTLNYSQKYTVQIVRLLKLRHNRGKGGAVRLGVLCARGEKILFADADGATRFSDFTIVETAMEELCQSLGTSKALAVGSRAHLKEESVVKRSVLRTLLMYGFHLWVWLFCVRTVRDTQCGFKLFTRDAAATLFPQMHMEGWAFDVELLFLAEKLNIALKEVSVCWTEIEGSKLRPLLAAFQMGRDIFIIWFCYTFNIWHISVKSKIF